MSDCIHGDVTGNHCFCDAGWFNDTCNQSLKQQWTEAFYIYQGCFLLFFLLMFIYSFRNLMIHLDEKKQLQYKSGCAFICSILNSPITICIILCNLICIIKLVWLAVDPFTMNGIVSNVQERILCEVVYSILFAIYGILLIVWFTIYDEVSFSIHQDDKKFDQKNKYLTNGPTKKQPSKDGRLGCHYFKAIMKFRIVLVFCLQITMSVLKGLRLTREQNQYHSYLIYALLYINFVIFIIEFAIYGFGLYNCINNQLQKIQMTYQNKLMEVQREYVTHLDNINKEKEQISVQNEQQQINKHDEIESQGHSQSLHNNMNPNLSESNDIPIESAGCKNDDFYSESHSKDPSQQFEDFEVSQRKPESISFQNPSEKQSQRNINGTQRNNSQHQNDIKTERKLDDIAENSVILDEEDFNINWSNKDVTNRCVNKFKEKQRQIVKDIKQAKGLSTTPVPETLKNETTLKMNEQERKYAKDEAKSFVQSLFTSKREHLNIDKKILAKIMMMAVCGIFLEVCFGVLSVIIFVSSILQTPIGTLSVLYVAGVLELLSLYLVLKLFKDIKSKEIENLIWIKKLGNKCNHITEKYLFKIPQEMHKTDKSKTLFELRINQISSLQNQQTKLN